MTVTALLPAASAIDALQDVVPDAAPFPPVAAFVQVTDVTPTLSEAVPPRAIGVDVVEVDVPEVGVVIEIAGRVVSAGV